MSGLEAMCISIKSFCPMSLLLFKIMGSNFEVSHLGLIFLGSLVLNILRRGTMKRL